MGLSRGAQRARNRKKDKARVGKGKLPAPEKRVDITATELARAEGLIWFVLITKPRNEFHAEDLINAVLPFVMAFTPVERGKAKRARPKPGQNPFYPTERPAYRRYVFVGVPEDMGGLPWERLEPLSFVSNYLAGSDGRPLRIGPKAVVEIMKASANCVFKGKDHELAAAPYCRVLYPGETVQGFGALKHLVAQVKRTEGGAAIIEGSSGPLVVPFELLEKAS